MVRILSRDAALLYLQQFTHYKILGTSLLALESICSSSVGAAIHPRLTEVLWIGVVEGLLSC